MKQKVYDFWRTIPKGKVVTYGQIAQSLGNKNMARTVGNILHVNPDPDFSPAIRWLIHKENYLKISALAAWKSKNAAWKPTALKWLTAP